MDAVISLFQCGFVFLFDSDYGFYLYLSRDRRSPQSSVFYSLDSDLRICFQRMDGFCYQILPDWWTYVPLLTLLLILKATHRLQQRTLNSFHCEDHKEDEEETLVQHATYHTRFLERLLSKRNFGAKSLQRLFTSRTWRCRHIQCALQRVSCKRAKYTQHRWAYSIRWFSGTSVRSLAYLITVRLHWANACGEYFHLCGIKLTQYGKLHIVGGRMFSLLRRPCSL